MSATEKEKKNYDDWRGKKKKNVGSHDAGRISRRDLCGVMILIIAERIFHALWTHSILKFISISPWSRIRSF